MFIINSYVELVAIMTKNNLKQKKIPKSMVMPRSTVLRQLTIIGVNLGDRLCASPNF